VNAALELGRQHEAGFCPRPAEVHVAGGTLGTAVGLAIGFTLLGWNTSVVAHRITSRAITNRRLARRLATDTLALLHDVAPVGGLPSAVDAIERLRIEHDQIGRGYGFDTEAGVAASDWFAAKTGLHLEATYTAKAAAGFLAAVARGERGPLLYWHTLSAVSPLSRRGSAT
jgi:D-cysteine desulfhydrase